MQQEYTVKSVKSFVGMEGHGFNASLYRNGKKVAFVIDDANGGDYHFQWCDWKVPKVEIHITTHEGKPHTFKGTPEEKILYEIIETLPKESSEYFPDGLKVSVDTFVSKIIDKFESERWMKRNLKSKFLFQIGDKIGSGEYQTFKKHPSITKDWVESYITKTYPNKKYTILG